VTRGEFPDAGADGGETGSAGGGEVLGEAQLFEQDGLEGGGLGGIGVVVEFAEERDEALDERRVGVGAEAEASGADFAGEPHGGDAAGHAIRVPALAGSERREAPRAFDDEGEALLRVGDDREVVDEPALFFEEGHGSADAGPDGSAVSKLHVAAAGFELAESRRGLARKRMAG
jgi:hypothetical protein